MVSRDSLRKSEKLRKSGLSLNSLVAMGALMDVDPDAEDIPPRGAEAERMTVRLPPALWQRIEKIKGEELSRSQATSAILTAISNKFSPSYS